MPIFPENRFLICLIFSSILLLLLLEFTCLSSLQNTSAIKSLDDSSIHRQLSAADDTRIQTRFRKHARCTMEEMRFQAEYFDYANPNICAEDIWRTIQLLMPEASVFIDVGANRGYFAAMLFGYWSPGHGLSRKQLYKHLQEDAAAGRLKNSEQLNTYCDDSLAFDVPFICYGRKSGECSSRKNFTVHSFDGQETHYLDANYTIQSHFPHLAPGYPINRQYSHVKGTWIYNYAAMTDNFDEKIPYG